jgi:hypothetical protein
MPPRSCAGALLTCANVLAAAGLASAFLERPGSAIDLATAATTTQQQPTLAFSSSPAAAEFNPITVDLGSQKTIAVYRRTSGSRAAVN